MANELTSANTDLTQSEVLSMLYLEKLADRNMLMEHPSLVYAGTINKSGSTSVSIPHVGFGYDLPTQVGEGVSVGNTAFSTSQTAIAVTRYAKQYEQTDLFRIIDKLEISDPAKFAADAALTHQLQLTSLIAKLMDSFSANTAGTTNTALSVTAFLAGIAKLEIATVQPPYLAMLHSKSFTDLKASVAASSAGAVQWREESQSIIGMVGGGFKLSFLGADIFVTNQIDYMNGTTDRGNGIFGRGAVVWADAIPDPMLPTEYGFMLTRPSLNGSPEPKVKFQISANAASQITSMTSTSYLGVSKAIDEAGCTLLGKA